MYDDYTVTTMPPRHPPCGGHSRKVYRKSANIKVNNSK